MSILSVSRLEVNMPLTPEDTVEFNGSEEERGQPLSRAMEDFVVEKPLLAIAIAFLVGIVFSRFAF